MTISVVFINMPATFEQKDLIAALRADAMFALVSLVPLHQANRVLRNTQPAVALVWLENGVESEEYTHYLTKWRKSTPTTAFLFLVADIEHVSLCALVKLGQVSCVDGRQSDSVLLQTIHCVAAGQIVLPKPQLKYLIGQAPAERNPDFLSDLTPREREVAQLVADCLSNQAIANQLDISRRTVEYHATHAYEKLNLSSRGELIALFKEK